MKKIILETGNSPNSRGFFSFVNQYLAACFAFEKEQNTLVTFDLISKSAYYDTSITHTDNVWNYFFEDVKELENPVVERIAWSSVGNMYGYTFDFNNTEERRIAERIIKENIILKPEIEFKISDFYEKNFKGKKVLGIHKRGTDIGYHHKKKELEEYIREIDAVKSDYDVIFISTDERSVIDALKKKYENIIYYSYDSLSADPKLPNFKSPTMGGYKMGEDALVDAFLLSKTSFLIQTNSNLSNFSLLANSNLKFKRIQ